MENWKERAYTLFFIDHLSINDVAAGVNKSRKAVSEYLSTCNEFEFKQEKERRKSINKLKRKGYQKEWDKTKRKRSTSGSDIEMQLVKRQHIIDVGVLSHEKF